MILVAIGANLPGPDGAPPLTTCRRAALALDALPGLRLVALSRWWETAAWPDPSGPRFINGVARLAACAGAPAWEPEALLGALHAIEARFGRTRGEPNAPRTLDLDLVDFEGEVRDGPGCVLPHPRAHLRGFVMVPLLEVAPGWVEPRLGVAGSVLRDGVSGEGMRVV